MAFNVIAVLVEKLLWRIGAAAGSLFYTDASGVEVELPVGTHTNGEVLTLSSGLPSWASPTGGSGVSDGDKGDITVSGSGATWTIDNLAITTAKIADDAVTLDKLAELPPLTVIGNGTTATADPQALTISTGLTATSSNLLLTNNALDIAFGIGIGDRAANITSTDVGGIVHAIHAGSIVRIRFFSDTNCSATLDILKNGTTIFGGGSTLMTLSSSMLDNKTSMTGITTSVADGDIYTFNLATVSGNPKFLGCLITVRRS